MSEQRHDTLAEILGERDLIDAAALERLQTEAADRGESLEAVLRESGTFTRPRLLQILENHHFCPAVDVTDAVPDPELIASFARNLATRHRAIPLERTEQGIVVALANPLDRKVEEELRLALGGPVLLRVGLEDDLRKAIARAYGDLDESASRSEPRSARERPEPLRGPAPIRLDPNGTAPELVDAILAEAVRRHVTDVHLNPREDGTLAVRFRMDGILHTMAVISPPARPAVLSRVKVIGGLDIAENRLPQDGRLTAEIRGATVDMRVSVLPAQYGQNVVVRLLARDPGLLDLENLGMPPAIRELHRGMIEAPLGLYLVTGPTGSGKTTTLYATLNQHDREHTNVITLEDPVEVRLEGVTQVQIHEEAGLTFAGGLRSILRQDPDVVLVGEIRDLETMEIACRAALTGHKVLSTIHTNDACLAVTRLLDMGTPPHLLTATLRGVLAQRLVRRICGDCKEAYVPTETERALLGRPSQAKIHRGRGCPACSGTGYAGRIAVFEYFQVDEMMCRLILERASPYAIRHAAQRAGMVFLRDFACRAVLAGETTVAEIQRVVVATERREQVCSNCERVVSVDFSNCPFCRNVLRDSCASCGVSLDPAWEACPSCGKTVEREWQKVFCCGCLAPVDPGWESCHYCGEALS